MSFVIYLPHVVGSRETRRAYDVGSITSVVAYDGNNSKYDIALNLHDEHQQWMSAHNALRLWREWKRQHRCYAQACFLRRQSDTPGSCTFCQLAEQLECNGYRVLPDLPRFRLTPLHAVTAVLLLSTSVLAYRETRPKQTERVGGVSLPYSAQAVAKSPNIRVLGRHRAGGGGDRK